MPARHQPLPQLWLVTDERQGDRLLPAVRALPRGSAVVFRHFRTAGRLALLAKVQRAARARGVAVLVATERGGSWSAAGNGLRIAVVHDRAELRRACRMGGTPDALFVSPVHTTQTHPGDRVLGPAGFARLASQAPVPVIALGGMDARRWRRLRHHGAHGWAAIDGLTPGGQKWKAVPR